MQLTLCCSSSSCFSPAGRVVVEALARAWMLFLRAHACLLSLKAANVALLHLSCTAVMNSQPTLLLHLPLQARRRRRPHPSPRLQA